jgi:hypothetical protein
MRDFLLRRSREWDLESTSLIRADGGLAIPARHQDFSEVAAADRLRFDLPRAIAALPKVFS